MSFRLSSVKYDGIKDMINKFKGDEKLELETRFMGKNFRGGKLDLKKYTETLNYFVASKENGGLGLKNKVKSELQVFDDYDTNKRLVIEGQPNIKKYWLGEDLENIDHTFMGKSRKAVVDVNEYSVRFSLAEEKDLDKGNEAIEYIKNTNSSSMKMYRLKNRYEVFSENGLARIDFTSVKQSSKTAGSFKNSDTLKSNVKYEIEVELLHSDKIKKMSVEDIFKEYMLVNYLILSLVQKNRKVLNISQSNSILQNYMKLVDVKRSNKMNKFNKGRSSGGKFNFITASPVTLHVENISRNSNVKTIMNSYAVTVKADGERRLLYVDTDDKVYLLDSNQNITNLDFALKGWSGSLVECEYVEDIGTVLMYDMLFSKGRDIRRTHLKVPPSKRSKNNLGRLDNLEYFKSDLKKMGNLGIKIDIKKYLFSTRSDGCDIFEKAKELWCDRENLLYHIDGLIFVPIKEHYPLQGKTWNSLFKWKPPELNTIDFLVKTVKDKNGSDIRNPFLIEVKGVQGDFERTFQQYKTLELYVGGNVKQNNGRSVYGPKMFEPLDEDDENEMYNRTNVFINTKNEMETKDILSGKMDTLNDNTIVEFGYLPDREEGFRWFPYRVRYDKTEAYRNGANVFGNNEMTANDVFRAIMVPVTEEVIVTGKIPPELKQKAEQMVTKGKNNSQNNSYYKYVDSNYQPGKRASYQKFHTIWVKEQLFKSVAPSIIEGVNKMQGRLIDFASGKGGDIPRYKRSKYAYVLGIEQDIKNIEKAKELYSKIPRPKPKAYFVRGDLRKLIFPNYDAGLTENNRINLEKFLPTKYTFNAASVMFAFHYFFESEITIRSFLQNVTDNLEVGGHLVGTTFDGKKLFDKLKGKKKISGNLDGELLWSIEKKYKSRTFPNTRSSLGRYVDVFVRSIGHVIPEPLVNFDYVDTLMEEYGMEKVEIKSFSEYFDDMEKNGNNSMKGIAKDMSEAEKEWSFLSSAFIYKKVRNAADSVYSKLVKLMAKEETKKAKKEAKKEVKETMDELGVEEVTEETEELIEGEEVEEDLNTDAESDLDINMDDGEEESE